MRARPLAAVAALCLFPGFGPAERATPTRWALVVGISDYIHFGDEVGGDLPGAASDARAVADVLVARYGFAPEHVRLVLDHAATRERLEGDLSQWLPSVARPGDLVWVYFAGHGSQAWDLDGDEEDGLDETVCPADVLRGSTENDILDDEIGEWLRALPTENVVVVWDKCHARSSTRAHTPLARPRSLGRDIARDVERPEDAVAAAPGGVEDAAWVGGDALEIAAAQADEVALDAAFPARQGEEPRFGGAFTTHLVRNLWNASPGATYADVFDRTREDMRRNRFRQRPSIDEKPLKDRPLFWLEGGGDAADVPGAASGAGAVRVLERAGTSAALSGGAAADMTVGSVYRAGEALLEVVRVEADRAQARLAPAPSGAIASRLAVGAPARLEAYRYPGHTLRVGVSGLPASIADRLRRELDGVASLMLVGDGTAFAHLLVHRRNDHYVVLSLDGFPRDSVAAAGRTLGGAPAVEGVVALAGLLERELGQFHLAELEHPAPAFPLVFAFGNGRNDFVLGEAVSFEVTSGRDGYLTIVDLAADGTVSVIFPNEYVRDNRVEAGRPTVFPSPEMDLVFPAVEPVGRGIVRAFVTERPLMLPFTSGDATAAAEVWTALRAAAGRPPIEGSDAVPVSTWATAAIVYDIRAR